MFTFEFDHFHWLLQLYSEWRQISKLVNLKISAKVRVCDSGKNLKMTETSQFCSIQSIKFTYEFDHSDWHSQFYSE